MKCNTRFAPSPSGSLHAGGARTALFSWLKARATKGVFTIRIEDTDQQRSTDESIRSLIRDLVWLGLDWNQGPSKNPDDLKNNQLGMYGPYFQSQRLQKYDTIIQNFIRNGYAYEKDGAIYFKLHHALQKHGYGKEVTFNDIVLGHMRFQIADLEEEFVVRRSDGYPTYHLAVVVDDASMGINHVIRGQEHLINTPKHIALYVAIGRGIPIYGHLPIILNQDGSKMSKRQENGQVTIEDFRRSGYLAPAILNYLCLLGWAPPDKDKEIFDINYAINNFVKGSLNSGNAKFDYKKLASVNSHYIKAMTKEQLKAAIIEHSHRYHPELTARIENLKCLDEAIEIAQPRMKTLTDFITMYSYILNDKITISTEANDTIIKPNLDQAKLVLGKINDLLGLVDNWSQDEIMFAIKHCEESLMLPMRDISQVIRVAVTGTTVSPPIQSTIYLLGREKSIERISSLLK